MNADGTLGIDALRLLLATFLPDIVRSIFVTELCTSTGTSAGFGKGRRFLKKCVPHFLRFGIVWGFVFSK